MSPYSPELIDSVKETRVLRLQTCITRKRSMKRINLWLLIMCILSGISGVAYLVFDPLVRSIVLNKLTLSKHSETFEIWSDPPISPHFKVYFWNFTNPEEFFEGKAQPKLQEIGPFTYRQKWLKQNISWYENGTISYRTRKIFTFSPSESCEGCDDKLNVTTLNVPAISANHQFAKGWYSATLMMAAMKGFGYKMWTTRTVHELLWGHNEPLFGLAQFTSLVGGEAPPFTEFGFFLKKNTSKEEELGLYTMYTGQGDPYKLANIAKFNGIESLERWNGTECDRVNGSDGASFNPYIQQQDTLWFFNDQLCRAMPLVFHQELDNQEVPCYRFKPREDVFMPKTFPDQNSCYGLEGHVIGDGLFDVRNCQFDAPIVLSWPHFLHAEDKYRQAVTGISPQEDIHGFWFDIQPVTGTTLSAKARVQVNVFVRKMDYTDQENIKEDTVVPCLWFEEGIDELGSDIINVLKRAAVDPIIYRQYILYLFTVCICIEVFLAFICFIRICQGINVDKMNEVIDQIPGGLVSGVTGGVGGAHRQDLEQADQPMLAADSTDESRVTTASHSRNCSEGVKPPYISGSSEARDIKLMEDLSSRLSQKLTSQFQYNNIQEGSENELASDLEAMLPNHSEEDLPSQTNTGMPTQIKLGLPTQTKTKLPTQNNVVRRQQVVDTKESFEEAIRVQADQISDSTSDEDSESEFEGGANVALVHYKPRLTSVSSSITS